MIVWTIWLVDLIVRGAEGCQPLWICKLGELKQNIVNHEWKENAEVMVVVVLLLYSVLFVVGCGWLLPIVALLLWMLALSFDWEVELINVAAISYVIVIMVS